MHKPLGAISSSGVEAIELAASAGLFLDPWQQMALDLALAERADGQWAAFEVGLVVGRQNGKGDLGLDTPILTTDGWETMGSIRAGQYVYGADGTPTRVVACSEVFTDHDCYEVKFTDGASYVAGADHLWHVRNKSTGKWENRTTSYLASRFGKRRADNGRMEYNFRVRCDVSPDTPDADLPIDPYLFGFWLGDGTSTSSTITVGHDERDWVVARLEQAGAQITSVSVHDHGHAIGLRFRLDAKVRDGFESRARRLGVWGNKHIPELYLTASTKQRRALLAGLLDSDGSIAVTNRSPQVEFSTSFPALADGFHRLARSLGIRVTRSDYPSSFNGQRFKDRSRFMWTPTFDPFDMPRKSARFAAPASERQSLMSVIGVDRVATVPTRCIQVARPDGVYLVGHYFTPTHNSIIEARELAGLFLFGERLILHTAHIFNTSWEAFLRLCQLIESTPDLERKVRQIRKSHVDVSIELKSGQRLRFIARNKGSGRGFSGDCVILDEAMYVDSGAVGALLPTLSARPNPQVWYTGSAPFSTSTQLHALRRRALGGEGERLAYMEWSIDPDVDDPDDPASWAKANPALGIRIPVEFVRAEREAMPPSEFARERLGIPDEEPADNGAAVSIEVWRSLADPESEWVGLPVGVADVSPDGRCSLALVGMRADGMRHVELVDNRSGTGWVAERRSELAERYGASAWVRDPSGPAVELEGEWTDMTPRQYAEACAGFVRAAVDGEVPHGERFRWTYDSDLDRVVAAALRGAARKERGDGALIWTRRRSGVDISPLVAMTIGWWAAGEIRSGDPLLAVW